MSSISENLINNNSDVSKRYECLETRIDRIIHDVRFHLDFTEDEGEFDGDNLFIILKYLDYARLRDETWIIREVFPIFRHKET